MGDNNEGNGQVPQVQIGQQQVPIVQDHEQQRQEHQTLVLQGQGQQVQFSSVTNNLPKLDGSNYHSWVEMQELALEIRGWKSAITSGNANATVSAQAKLMLLEAMNESHRAQVRGCGTAKDIMDRLRLIYADRSAANLYRLLHQYYRYSKSAGDSMSEHIGKMDEMRRKLFDLGEKQSEAVYQVTLIGSLPAEYGSLMEVWELTHKDMRTTENLVSRLLKREEDLKKMGTASLALVAANNRTGRPRMSSEEWAEHVKKLTCFNCQEKGHLASKCKNPAKPRVFYDGKKGTGQDQEKSQAAHLVASDVNFMVSRGHSGLRDKWVCDSGASSHMCNNLRWFEAIKMSEGGLGSCYIGNGKAVEIKGVGSVRVESFVNGVWIKSRLNNVNFVPELSTNLISVGQAGEFNVITTFDKDCCTMTLAGKQVASGIKLEDGLYLMRMRADDVTPQVALTASEGKTLEHYHKVLGHVGSDRVETLLKDLAIEYKPLKSFECADCPGGKGHHASHPSVGSRATGAGIIHADLSGIVNKTSLQGFKYYMVCKDEFTEFTFVYFCKEKSEVPSLIARMIIDFETLSGKRVTEFHSDHGSEFVNKVTEILFMKERIKHRTSAPFCPQQNGRIEREMQSITTMARTMLNASKLLKELWPQAVEAAVHIKNRLPTSRTRETPFERLTQRKPTIQHLVEFGKPCHLVVNDQYLTKWDCRTIEGFVVGFTNRRNTYQVYIPSKRRVTESCDIYFAAHDMRSAEPEENPPGRADKNSEETVTQRAKSVDPLKEMQSAGTNQSHEDSWLEKQLTSTPTDGRGKTRPVITGRSLQSFFDRYIAQDKDIGQDKKGGSDTDCEPIYENIHRESSDAESSGYLDLSAEETVRPRPTAPSEWQQPCTETTCHSLDASEMSPRVAEQDAVATHSKSAFIITRPNEELPYTYHDAMQSDEKQAWTEAIAAELDALADNDTWAVVNRPPGVKLLSTKWVFALKRDKDGNVDRHKARLVVRGFEQRAGIDFYETFAPVARLESIRTLLSICAIKQMTIVQFDISTAFLNGRIEEDVYLAKPMGLDVEDGQCLKLNKALYGLKQAPRAWNSTFNESLIQLGFAPTLSDTCVYVNKDASTYLAIYVDDGIVMSKNESNCLQIVEELEKRFKMKRLDGSFFLGIEIEKINNKMRLSQRRYSADIVDRFNLSDARTVTCPIIDCKTLMEPGEDLDASVPYREAIGCLQYLACVTRPDLLFSVSFLASFSSHPRQCHWQAVKRVLRYVKHTLDYGITYDADQATILAYSDADWGNDLEARRSVSGVLILLGGGPIIFSSRKQSNIAQSSTESEYVAACEAAKELKWLTQFLGELSIDFGQPRLLVDNTSAIFQIATTDIKRKCKHVELRFHFVKLEHQRGLFKVQKVDSEEQAADLLTKGLSGPQIERLLKVANMGRPRAGSQGMAKVALFLVLALSFSQVEAIDITHVELTGHEILVATDIQAARGVNILNFEAKFPNLCEIPAGNSTDSIYGVKKDSYDQYQSFCLSAFRELGDALQQLATCLPEPLWTSALNRVKRFFDPVSGLVVASVFAVVWIGKTIISYANPTSDHNMVQDHQERIDKLVEHEKKSLSELEAQQKLLNVTSERAIMNEKALKQAAAIHTEIAWQSSRTGLRIWSIKEGLREMEQSCRDHKLSVTGLGRFVPLDELPALAGARDRDTHLKRMNVISNDTLSLTVHVNVIDPKSAIYKVVGLSHWANITTKPVWVDYYGPSYVVVNTTSNCQRGIDQPTGKVTFETCEEENFRDPTLDDYRPSGNQEDANIKAMSKPFIYDTGNAHIVYCLYQNITIYGKVHPCPAEPIKLDKGISFSLGNFSYHVGLLSINRVQGQVRIATDRLLNITSPEFTRTAEMWETIKNNNEEAKKRIKYDLASNTAAINMSIMEWALYSLSAIASLITIGVFAGQCVARKRSGQEPIGSGLKREEDIHSEQINININEPQLHSDFSPEYKAYLEALSSLASARNLGDEAPGTRPVPKLKRPAPLPPKD